MKKALISLSALLLCFALNAQTWSITAGYDHSIERIKTSTITNQHYNGCFIGINWELPEDRLASFFPSIYINGAYAKDTKGFTTTISKYTLSVPLDIKFTFLVGARSRLFLYAGPEMNIGLSGKIKGGSETIDLYKNDVLKYRRFVLNGNAGFGYEHFDFRVFAEYAHNAMSLCSSTLINAHYFKFGVSYKF